MRTGKKGINNVFITLIILTASNYLGFYQILAKTTQVYFTDMICIVSVILCLFYGGLTRFRAIRTIPQYKTIKKYVWFFLAWSLIEILGSYIRYGETQGVMTTIKESLFCLTPVFIYFFMSDTIRTEEDVDSLIDKLIIVSFLCSVISIIAFVLLSVNGNNFMNLEVENYSFIRNGRGHFMIGTMVVVPSTLFLWVRLLKRRISAFQIVTFALNLFHIVYIGQVRTLVSYILVSILLLYVYVSKRSRWIKAIIIIAFLLIILVLGIDYIKELISEYGTNNSYLYRLEAVSFYIEQLLDSPIFGMGYIGSSNVALQRLLYGPNLRCFRTDVGVVGFANCMGVVALVWFVALMIFLLKLFLKSRRSSDVSLYFIIFWIFVVISSINLFFIDGFRIIYFPLLLTIGNCIERGNKGKKAMGDIPEVILENNHT